MVSVVDDSMVGFWDYPCGNQGTRSGSIPWPSWTVWSFMGMLAFLEVKHASFEASPFPARWQWNSFHNSSWIEGGTSWNLVASGTLKIFWRSFEDLQVLRFSFASPCTWVALAKVRTKACASLMPISGCRGSSWTGWTCCSKVQQKAEKRGKTPRLSRFLTDSFGSWLVSDHFPQIQMATHGDTSMAWGSLQYLPGSRATGHCHPRVHCFFMLFWAPKWAQMWQKSQWILG